MWKATAISICTSRIGCSPRSRGRPIPRGAWAQVPPYVLVPLMAAIAVLGYFVPLLGIPLAGFLVVDVILGEIGRRRRTAA